MTSYRAICKDKPLLNVTPLMRRMTKYVTRQLNLIADAANLIGLTAILPAAVAAALNKLGPICQEEREED